MLEDWLSGFPVPRGMSAEVLETASFRRIRDTRRTSWESDPKREEQRLTMTQTLRTPIGTMQLRPIQAAILKSLQDHRSAFVSAGVGRGKTLASLLAAEVCDAQRPVLIVPPSLCDETRRMAYALGEHWKIRPVHILSYGKVSNVHHRNTLASYRPDLVICDECDEIKNATNARGNRIIEAVHANKARCLFMTGTPVNRTMREYRHLMRLCFGDNTPFPEDWDEFCIWSLAIDEKVPDGSRVMPGALLNISPPDADDPVDNEVKLARVRFGRRLRSWPGIIVSNAEHPQTQLTCQVMQLQPTDAIIKAATYMRVHKELPCGIQVDTPLDMWRHDREFACGLYGRWKYPAPSKWMFARKAWGQVVRDVVSRQKKWDSPMLIAGAIERGEIEDGGVYADWRKIEPSFVPETEWVWICESMLDYAAAWVREHRGIVWVVHRHFAAELERRTGVPWFGFENGGKDARGLTINQHDGPAIASIRSNLRGFNLQGNTGQAHNKAHHTKNLYVTCPTKNWVLEQSIGRTWREGQTKDVSVQYVLRLEGCLTALTQACADAEYVSDTVELQRLKVAKWLPRQIITPT